MNFKKIKSIAEKALAQGEHLGTLAWWSLNGSTIETAALAAKAKAAGLDERYLPKAIKPVAAFRRAWRHAARKCPAGLMLREIGETRERIEVGLVKEDADVEHASLDYGVVGRITFEKAAETMVVHQASDITAEVERLYGIHHDHGSEDIRAMLTGLMREAGVSIRDAGGVYFVPPSFAGALAAMCAVVEGIGHNHVFTLPVADVGSAKATLAEVARATLDDEIRALEGELDAFASSGADTRDGTLARRLTKFDELRSRVTLFSGCLSFKADGLVAKIGGLQEELRDKLNGRVLEKAVAALPKGAVAIDDPIGF
ncbi:MAG: hypothetical protein Q8O67_15050 [Deltaproteobacteria bacterium]|nr:hypothetical protein [Deltaproteobacteria bacterium]